MEAENSTKNKNFLLVPSTMCYLTKDNLAKRNWSESKKCCFCDLNETIQHLFFDCQHAKTIWRVVHVATGLTPPKSISHMLGHLLTGINQ